jgi:hypothetical protein
VPLVLQADAGPHHPKLQAWVSSHRHQELNIIKPLQVKDIHRKCSPFHCQDHTCILGWVTSFILIKEISKFLKRKNNFSLKKKKK